jgi:signal transduction histidine kinase
MVAIALRRNRVEAAWVAFCLVNIAAMIAAPKWETIPFHFIWTSLTILYGFRVWRPETTLAVLIAICLSTGSLILLDAQNGDQAWGELFEVPLMSAMFLAMVWHARRRQAAMEVVASQARDRAELLEQQESFMNDVSHELRTPLTIARGHIEALARATASPPPEAAVALDELDRLGRLVEQLLVLGKAGHADNAAVELQLDDFLEEVVMRWSEVAPRAWRVGQLAGGRLSANPDALRIALDALIENAVHHTDPGDVIEVRSRSAGPDVVIDVADTGHGIPPHLVNRMFDRFARGESGTRSGAGLGLGLAIVHAIARGHGGACAVTSSEEGSIFCLRLPGFQAQAAEHPATAEAEPEPAFADPLEAATLR